MANDQSPLVVSFTAILGRIAVIARKALGFKQGPVAKELGIAQASYSKIERGATCMTIEYLVALAGVFDMLPHELVQEAEKAAEHLQEQGIEVVATREETQGRLLLEGSALEKLIEEALKSEENEED
jgi:transcriptional regulator with XRE-family HTH domain